jgi:Mn-dependent DtxR family transcriptional regulator
MSRQPLTGKYAALFYEDAPWELNGYATKFAARRGIMLHAVNRGWTLEDCRRDFLNSYYPGSKYWTTGDAHRRLSHAQSEKRIRDDYSACAARASQQPTYHHKGEVCQELSILIDRVEARAWSGRTGRTDRDVLVGVLKRMSDIGSDRINFSARDAMLAAGLGSPATASNALKRLVSDEWLELTEKGGWRAAAEYKSNVTARLNRPDSTGHREMGETKPEGAEHETWLHLGKASRDLYGSLTSEPQTARQLAKAANVHPSTASRNLPKLESEGMAVKKDDGWIIGPLSPDDVVYSYGWLGDNSKTQKRQDRVTTDRIAYAMMNQVTVRDTPEFDTPALVTSPA